MKSKLTPDALLLCSHLALPKGTGAKLQPLSPSEWNELAGKVVAKGLRPGHLLDMTQEQLQAEAGLAAELSDRLAPLLLRGTQLAIEVDRLSSLGIWILTRSDERYPQPLKDRLDAAAPPILFGSGDSALLKRGYLAVVGSRDIDEKGAESATAVGHLCAREEKVLV